MHLRATGVSITTTAQFAAEYFVTKASPYMFTDIGGGTFFFFAACTALNVVWVVTCVPETKGRTLEAMEEAFTRQGGISGGRDAEAGEEAGKGGKGKEGEVVVMEIARCGDSGSGSG